VKVAVPWSLSHYIPLNGFHPLYRALFDHAPADIDLTAWDNVKLHRHFAHDPYSRARVASRAISYGHETKGISSDIARSHADYFYPPDRVLTEAISGEIEFHHTAPFPSLKRPFVFHCESFAPIFFPNAQQGAGKFDRPEALRLHYKGIFASPLCQGIYSHIPGTLDSLSNFFSDPAIEAKLFGSKIGLSKRSVDPTMFRRRQPVDRPRFLFINSAHQMPSNFFNRGGHVVLRFWKEFRNTGREGLLILRCGKPNDEALASHGVDPAFVRSELGRSIIWAEGYLANHEVNALMADAHFFLLPSASLHSASLLLAMTLGTVPIVTDTLGTSVYVTDRESAIVLKGVRDEIWHLDPNTGLLTDHYERMPNVAPSLVTQLVERVFELLDSTDAYETLSDRTAERARTQFSGESFASEFWGTVTERAKATQGLQNRSSSAELTRSLQHCTLDSDAWARVFESSTQPMPLLDTGVSKVFEVGGAAVHRPGDTPPKLTDWSVFARYFSAGAPDTVFANSLVELGDLFVSRGSFSVSDNLDYLRRRVSLALMRFPAMHSLASRHYRTTKTFMKFVKLWLRHSQCKRGVIGSEKYVALVMEDVHNFNIVRYFHKYYAIPCGEGPFIASKAEKKLYSKTFSAYSLERAIAKVSRGRTSRLRLIANLPILSSIVSRIGKHRVRAVLGPLMRKRNPRQ